MKHTLDVRLRASGEHTARDAVNNRCVAANARNVQRTAAAQVVAEASCL